MKKRNPIENLGHYAHPAKSSAYPKGAFPNQKGDMRPPMMGKKVPPATVTKKRGK